MPHLSSGFFRLASAWRALALALAGSALLAGCRAPADQAVTASAGVAVTNVDPGGAFAEAGIAVGDRLLAFTRAAVPPTSPEPATGPIRSCLDFAAIETEQSPRGAVELSLLRRGRPLTVVLPPGAWLADVEPGPPDSPAAVACEALDAARRAYPERNWKAAEAAFERAAQAVGRLGEPRWLALVRNRQGLTRLAEEDLDGAERALREGLTLRQREAPGGLAEAASWHSLGTLAQQRGDSAAADQAFARAREIRQALAPLSLDLAWTLTNLGIDAYQRQDREQAETFYQQAYALMARLRPESPEVAGMLTNLGLLARESGHLVEAEERLEAARRLYSRLEPEKENGARNLVSLAVVAMDRGDLARAEDLLQAALARFEKLAPESREVAQIYENLGKIARDRAQYLEAETLLRHSLAIRRKLDAGPTAEARSLSPLAWVLFRLGRLDEAESVASEVLALARTSSPESPDDTLEASSCLQTLAEVTSARGDFAKALPLMERALRFRRANIPGSLRLAIGLETYGELLDRGGRPRDAERPLREAIALFEHLAPGSFQLAKAQGDLGAHLEHAGQLAAAAIAYRAAVGALEEQLGRLGGGDDSHADFQVEYGDLYQRLISLELRLGHPAIAFEVLERSRGRSLLAELAQRDLRWSRDLEPTERAEQRELDAAYDRAQRELAQTDTAGPGGRREALLIELAGLRGRRAAWNERLRREAPRFAALRDPRPVDLATLRRALDPGTLWLSYSVGAREAFLFVVRAAADEPDGPGGPGASGGPGATRGLRVITLATDRERLAEEVAIFRSLILRGRRDSKVGEELWTAGEGLHRLLLAPAAPELAAAKRLLISPDGPLHVLPFAALVPPRTSAASPRRYLVETRPLAQVLSASVWLELRRRDSAPDTSVPVASAPSFAFVEPAYPLATSGPAALGERGATALRRYQAGLAPLPGTRLEAEALASLFGPRLSIFAAAEARERRVKSLPPRASFVHFASHALLDRDSPLDSGLALARPERPQGGDDNGLLQAWEIFDQLRLEADLVTLSACETGLGRDGAGEGLIGLSRAFQYAGARSVLASLWQVSDRSTAELMRRFYAAWAAGRGREEALAEAQRALLATAETAHPFHWAAFELDGDGR